MNRLAELELHTNAIAAAIESNPKFFASVQHYVKQLQQLLSQECGPSQAELRLLAKKLDEFWAKWRPNGDGFYIPPREAGDTDSTVRQIVELVESLVALDTSDFEREVSAFLNGGTFPGVAVATAASKKEMALPCVFIGHGRNKLWATLKMYLEDELGLATVAYESEPRTGDSIVPVLEKMLAQATFAVLVLTAEDAGPDGSRRARQNVVHEAGLFQGRLGFKKAVLLVQDGIEEFSNVAGLQHIKFSQDQIEQSFYELQRVLKREGHLGTG